MTSSHAGRLSLTGDELSLVGGLLTVENSDYALCVLDGIQEHDLHAGPAKTALAKVAEAAEALATGRSGPTPRSAEIHGVPAELTDQQQCEGARALLWEGHSGDQDHTPAASGVIVMPGRATKPEEPAGWWHAASEPWALRRIAFGIRDLLQQATGDRSISVTVADRDGGASGEAAAGEPVWWCAHHGEEGTSWDGDEYCSGCHPDRAPAGGPVSGAADPASTPGPSASAENREER